MLNDEIMMALTVAMVIGLPVLLAGLYFVGRKMDQRAAAKAAAAPPPTAKPATAAKPVAAAASAAPAPSTPPAPTATA